MASTDQTATLSTLFPLVKILKTKLPLYATETDHDLGQLLLSTTPGALGGKMKLLAILCQALGREKPLKLLETRKAEKRLEIKLNASEKEKQKRSEAFLQAYSMWIWKELESLDLLADLQSRPKEPGRLFDKTDYYLKVVAGLVSRLSPPETIKSRGSIMFLKKSSPQSPHPTTLKKTNTDTTLVSQDSESKLLLPLEESTPKMEKGKAALGNRGLTAVRQSVRMAQEKAQKSGRVKELEEELASLKGRFDSLTKDHELLKSLFEAASGPANSDSTLDRRRAFLLKSQNIQQQRHLTALKEALDAKEGFVYEVQEDLYKIQDILRQSVATLEKGNKEKDAHAIVPQQLKSCIQYIDVAQKQMNRRVKDHLRDSSTEEKTPNYLFVSEFAAQPKDCCSEPVSLMDICSGDLKHLNLKHVSRLETQLHTLHHTLAKLHCSLDSCIAPNLLPELSEHTKQLFDSSQTELLSSLNSLLSLLILIPSAPSPQLDKIRCTGLPSLPVADEILAQLPNVSSSFKLSFRKVWDPLLKGHQAFAEMKFAEAEAHAKELEFHKSIYKKFNTEMLQVVKNLEMKRSDLKRQLEVIEYPLIQIKENISRLELHPAAVDSFLQDTEVRIDSVLDELRSHSLPNKTT